MSGCQLVHLGKPAQRRQPCSGRRLTNDAEVLAKPPGEIVPERALDPLIVDREKNICPP
jgi:hypothetical protein